MSCTKTWAEERRSSLGGSSCVLRCKRDRHVAPLVCNYWINTTDRKAPQCSRHWGCAGQARSVPVLTGDRWSPEQVTPAESRWEGIDQGPSGKSRTSGQPLSRQRSHLAPCSSSGGMAPATVSPSQASDRPAAGFLPWSTYVP